MFNVQVTGTTKRSSISVNGTTAQWLSDKETEWSSGWFEVSDSKYKTENKQLSNWVNIYFLFKCLNCQVSKLYSVKITLSAKFH